MKNFCFVRCSNCCGECVSVYRENGGASFCGRGCGPGCSFFTAYDGGYDGGLMNLRCSVGGCGSGDGVYADLRYGCDYGYSPCHGFGWVIECVTICAGGYGAS